MPVARSLPAEAADAAEAAGGLDCRALAVAPDGDPPRRAGAAMEKPMGSEKESSSGFIECTCTDLVQVVCIDTARTASSTAPLL